jgi:hypothetical protein
MFYFEEVSKKKIHPVYYINFIPSYLDTTRFYYLSHFVPTNILIASRSDVFSLNCFNQVLMLWNDLLLYSSANTLWSNMQILQHRLICNMIL